MIKPRSWRLSGGLDLVRDPLTRHRYPGALIGVNNYEAREEGYRRIDGYERFDGRKSPSDILEDDPEKEDEETEKRRAAIEAVPGVGEIWLWRYNNITYAFRKDVEGNTAKFAMHSSSKSGWSEVDLGYKVAFTVGSGEAPEYGASIEKASGASGMIFGHYLTSGTWAGGDAAGYIVISYDSGNALRFAASDAVTIDSDSGRTLTLSAVPALQEVGTGENFRFVNYNFFGAADRERMYGVSGKGNPFEFDGTMFLELEPGVTGLSPTEITAFQNHLFIGYKEGSITYSAIGNPRSYDSATGGAGEIGVGDILTGFVAGYRNVLFVLSRNKTQYVTGTSGANFAAKGLSDEAGAMAGTSVLMDEPVCLDDRGIRSSSATQQFGDFSIATISERIRPLLDFKRDGGILPVASVRVRRKSQYRIYFSDGDCIVASYVRRGPTLSVEYSRTSFDRYDADGKPDVGVVNSVCSVEDDDGRERVFFSMVGADYVYEMDRGKSFDGHRIAAYLRLAFNDLGTPWQIKRFKKALLEVDSVFRANFSITADFDDGRLLGPRNVRPHEVIGTSALWDESEWGNFYWDTNPSRTTGQRIPGRGRNLSLTMFTVTDSVDEPHLFSGVTVYYTDRKLKR